MLPDPVQLLIAHWKSVAFNSVKRPESCCLSRSNISVAHPSHFSVKVSHDFFSSPVWTLTFWLRHSVKFVLVSPIQYGCQNSQKGKIFGADKVEVNYNNFFVHDKFLYCTCFQDEAHFPSNIANSCEVLPSPRETWKSVDLLFIIKSSFQYVASEAFVLSWVFGMLLPEKFRFLQQQITKLIDICFFCSEGGLKAKAVNHWRKKQTSA